MDMQRSCGKGMYLKGAHFSSDYILPSKGILKRYVSDEKLKLMNELSPFEFVVLIGMPDETLKEKGYMDDDGSILEEKLSRMFSEDFYVTGIAKYLAKAYHTLFEAEYGYPSNSFRSCIDEKNNTMIYCAACFPADSFNPSFQMLTEKLYLEQLQDFMYRITGDRDYKRRSSLDQCTEYTKDYVVAYMN